MTTLSVIAVWLMGAIVGGVSVYMVMRAKLNDKNLEIESLIAFIRARAASDSLEKKE